MKRMHNILAVFFTTLAFSLLLTACASHEHEYGEWNTSVQATCTTDGIQKRTCQCGDEQTQTIYATGHTYGEWITTRKASCTQDGVQTRTCQCGDEQTKSVSATGHSYGTWTTIKQATCTQTGTKIRTCSCGDEQSQTITATGHTWKAATCTDAKTCRNCSATTGSALGHSKGSDGYCTRCGEKLSINMQTIIGSPNDCSRIKPFGFCYYKNSADGIKVCWGGNNLSGKTINYYSVTIYFYNSVDDPAYSEITGKSSKTMKYVGPVAPGDPLLVFSLVDYVPACSKIVIGEITVEYADGTSDTGWYGWWTTYRNSAID